MHHLQNITTIATSELFRERTLCRLPELEEEKTTNDNKREASHKENYKEPTGHQEHMTQQFE